MISISPTSDMHYVRNVFTSPDVWPNVCDDWTDDVTNYYPPEHETMFYLVPMVDGEPAGCLLIQRLNGVLVELHSALFPAYRGKDTGLIFNALVQYLNDEMPDIKRLRTWVPSCNRAATVAAKRIGMEVIGTEPKSYMKNNELHDLHLFGVAI